MNGPLPREPLHQPPDPADLRAFPPATADCAAVRGLLRDFVDGDLEPHEQVRVEDHAHGCRTCALALARVEHEHLRLRLGFAAMSMEPERPRGPRPGFAQRVVRRLVVDETSMLSREALDAARAAAPAEAPAPARRGLWRPFARSLAMAGLVLAALVVGFVAGDEDHGPERAARLVVTGAEDAYGEFGARLSRGDHLGAAQFLWVGDRGLAKVDWHDASAKSQPAATLALSNNGLLRMREGEPWLENGTVRVESARPVKIPVADGSRLELGVGDYVITAEELAGLHHNRANPLANAPQGLRVSIEVLRGDAANVVRREVAPTVVAPGQIGVYRGDSPVDIRSGPHAQPEFGAGRSEPPPLPALRQAVLRGTVLERSGAPVGGADVLASFGSSGVLRSGGTTTTAAGSFALETGTAGGPLACSTPFAILHVLPPGQRPELGLTVPEAFRLGYSDGDARLLSSPVLDVSQPMTGLVVDDAAMPVGSVRLVPCVVDELFSCVLPWLEGSAITDAGGQFRLERLPVVLPRHQRLVVLLLHPDLEPSVLPLPPRGSPASRAYQPPLLGRRLRTVRLVGLPQSASLQLFEEVQGLPAGTAMVRRSVTTNGQGEVVGLRVARGDLWLRNTSPSHPMVRPLVLESLAAVPVYRPDEGSWKPFDAVFQRGQALAGSDVLVAGSFRFQAFQAGLPAAGLTVQAVEAWTLRALAGAQVFGVRARLPRGAGAVRFLGYTSGSGTIAVGAEDAQGALCVLGADGAIGFAEVVGQSGDLEIAVSPTGQVLLDPALRPGSFENSVAVPIRFERADAPLAGMQPVFVRFACNEAGWEVADVPAGDYRAIVDGRAFPVTVPAGGLVVLP